jgi:hypothetical protein
MKNDFAQCSSCWQAVVARAADPDAAGENWMEHRWGRRRQCRAHVCISAGGGVSGLGRLGNVSMSGAFLETAVPLPLYAQLAIAVLRDDGATHQLEFTAVVVRREANGVGVEWCDPIAGSICRALKCDIDCGFAAETPA